MSVAMADCGISWNTTTRASWLTHLAVAIADGGDCLSDLKRSGRAQVLETSFDLDRLRTVKARHRSSCGDTSDIHDRLRRTC